MKLFKSTVQRVKKTLAIIIMIAFFSFTPNRFFDGTWMPLPYQQFWSSPGAVVSDDNWSNTQGVVGYRGDDLTVATGTNPQTILADGVSTPTQVFANQSSPNTNASGGVAEFDGIANPVVALQGSGTADAPHIVIFLNTTGQVGINVSYNLRDIDGSTDNAVQPVAVQYRVGVVGNYTNIPAGFVADATVGPSLTQSTPVSFTLPAACENQPQVQVRIITTNATGNDEWVGIDDINILAAPNVEVFAAGCVIPKVDFNLGETICGKISDPNFTQRRFQWISPNGNIFSQGPALTINPQTDSWVLPATKSFQLTPGYFIEARGTWRLDDGVIPSGQQASAFFRVHDPLNPAANLSVSSTANPDPVTPGSNITYTFGTVNKGPDNAVNVEFTMFIPANAVFVSAAGPAGWTVPAGPTGNQITCTRALLPAGAILNPVAEDFTLVVTVPAGTPNNTKFLAIGAIKSATEELIASDNTTATFQSTVQGGSSGPALVGVSSFIVTESCLPANNAIDPGETVTVNFCVQNNGNQIANNVMGTLLATNNVTSPGPAISFGNIAPAGQGCVNITFTGNPLAQCGSALIPSINLTSDPGGTNRGTAVFANPFFLMLGNPGIGNLPMCCTPSPSCLVASMTVNNQSGCNNNGTPGNAADDYYTVDLTVNFVNQPATGTLRLQQAGAVIDVVSVPVGSLVGTSHTFTGVRLRANGAINNITAEFSANPGCSASGTAPVVAACSVSCTLTCPANITVSNDPNQCGAIVNFPAATPVGACGTVTASPVSGSFFPVGTTMVTFTSTAGPTCSFNVTVNDTQAPTINCPANIVVCGAQVVPYVVTVADNCGIPALVQNTGLTPGDVNPVGVTVNSFTVTDASGNTATCSFTVTVHPIPNAIATPASQTVCSGLPITTIALSGGVPGTTYAWSRNNTGTVTGIGASGNGNISGTLTNTTNAPVTVTFTIIPTANGCPGTPIQATVLVNPTPNAIATPASQSVCSGLPITTIALSSGVPGTTYAWSRNNTVTVTGIGASGNGNISGTLTNTTNAPITVTFTITPTANGCTGTPVNATVLVNPIPNAVATPSTQTICPGPITTIVLTSAVSGTTYAWTRNNTANVTGIAASGTGNISGSFANTTLVQQTVTFTIVPTANGCAGPAITATVIVDAPPTIQCPAGVTLPSVIGGCTAVHTYSPTVTGSPVPTLTYTMTGATTASGSGSGSGTAFLVGITNVTITATNVCGTASCTFAVTVTDSQLPTITAQPINATRCVGQNATFSVTALTAPSAGGPIAYQWQQWNGSAWVNVAGATTSTLTINNVTLAMNTNTFRVVLTGLCSTVPSNPATLFVNPNPAVIISANPPASILPNQTTTLTATSSPSGGTHQWFFNGAAIPGATGSSYGPITIDQLGSYRVLYTSLAGCTVTSADFLVTGAISDILWVYPNPNRGQFQVRFYNQSNEAATIMVFNAKGQKMHEQKVTTGNQTYSQILVDLDIIANGMYIVQLVSGSGKVLGAKQILVEVF